ncbi:hypothetical protein ASPBRDRAFT_197779 [Aspergillus brasiliensis CBS 101740]|uniref:Rhodopsin domain-containing protein n=1 Tax=Aspergillus brasiliensis (strain CBS 101740 / IMI 381727 / IBT 21946) TaxID=767769 RepID=A0A1L9UEJ5_ASPBC|nr:hypothetical protein ASPBRDRAFT_197779 [Aspergillus brasiliensis CBS 101740]
MLAADGLKAVIILPILTVLATFFLSWRLIQRRKKHALAIDDWLLAFALFMLYIEDAGAFLLAVKGGEGKPMADLSEDEMLWLLKMFFWPELGYTILIFTIKCSILLSLKRIFWRVRWFRYALCSIAFLTTAWFIGVFFTVLFQCTPVDKAWLPAKPGHCIDLLPFLWGNSISNNLIDWMILFLPVVPVLRLQMSGSQKVILLGSFALGSVACIASLVRAVSTATIDVNDLSKSVFMASIWTYIEPSMGIISACLPFLSSAIGPKLGVLWSFFERSVKNIQRSTGTSQKESAMHDSLVQSEGPSVRRGHSYELDGVKSHAGSARSFV